MQAPSTPHASQATHPPPLLCIKKHGHLTGGRVSFISIMAEEEGFEPPRGVTRLSVFKTDPFSRTWVFLRLTDKEYYIRHNPLKQA